MAESKAVRSVYGAHLREAWSLLERFEHISEGYCSRMQQSCALTMRAVAAAVRFAQRDRCHAAKCDRGAGGRQRQSI